MWDDLQKTAALARAHGDTHFFTRAPCKRGHIDRRFVSSGECLACSRELRRSRMSNPKTRARVNAQWAASEKERRKNHVWAQRRRTMQRDKHHKRMVDPVKRAKRRINGRAAAAKSRTSRAASPVALTYLKPFYHYAQLMSLARGDLHVDHFVPLSMGGMNVPRNLHVIPAEVNLSKHDKHPRDFYGDRYEEVKAQMRAQQDMIMGITKEENHAQYSIAA